jgi:hypothetical protein
MFVFIDSDDISRSIGGIGFDVSEFLTHGCYDESKSDIHDISLPKQVDRVSQIEKQ